MNALDIRRAAGVLAGHGHDSDSATTADLIKAADVVGAGYPNRADQDAIREALDEIGGAA